MTQIWRATSRFGASRWRSRFVAFAVLAAVLIPVTAVEALVETTSLASDGTDHPVGAFGRVSDIAEANGTVYIVGDFTRVGGKTRNYAAAIDKATGRVDPNWNPNLNGVAYTVDVAPDGSAVYVGGKFTKVGSMWRARIAKLDPVTGQAVANWNPKASAKVMTVTATNDTVYLGGYFITVGGVTRDSLAAIDTATATVVAGWNPGANGAVLSSTLAPDGSKLYLGGNFSTLGGQTRPHLGAVTTAAGSVTSWNPAPPHKVIDVELSANGATVYTAIGGPQVDGGNRATAYAASNGTTLWDHPSDGDFQALAVADDAIYYGGHFVDIEGQSRQRLAAFDPASGDLLSWNPGANSGWGVWALTYTDRLYVGGDFTTLGGRTQKHFGMFSNSQNLSPTGVFSAGCAALTCQVDASDSVDPDGTIVLYEWTFGDGTSGTGQAPLHTYATAGTYNVTLTVTDDDDATDSQSDPVQASEAGNGIGFVAATGTKKNAASFTVTVPPSVSPYDGMLLFATVNNNAVTVNDPIGVTGWTRLGTVVDETMKTVIWSKPAAAGDAGSDLTVNLGAAKKTNVSLVAYTGTDPTTPVHAWAGAPEPSNTANHTTPNITATIDGSWIVSYWADKTSATTDWSAPAGELVRRETFGAGGGRVTMLLTDTGLSHPAGTYGTKTATANSSNSKATTITIALNPVSETTNQRPTAAFTSTCDALSCNFDGRDSVDPDGTVASYHWAFGDGTTGNGATPDHTFGDFATYAVTLTVTDNDGAADDVTADVHVTDPNIADIAFVGSDTTVGNAINHNLNVPATAQPGDSLLLFVTANSETATINNPTGVTGWTRLGEVSSDTMQTVAWVKTVATGDAGTRLTITLGSTQKTTAIVAAYSGTHPSSPAHRVASAPETAQRSGHTTPQVTTTFDGSWIVSYWADKTSATTDWTLPAGEVMRGEVYGTGAGRVTSILSDTGVPHPTGGHGAKTATADSANAKATMWTIALRPAS